MPKKLEARSVGALVCAVVMAVGLSVVLKADVLVQGTGFPPVTFNGHGGYSADALGQASPGGTVEAQVPGGSTVVLAYLYAATSAVVGSVDIDFDGTLVTLNQLPYNNRSSESSYRADVTAQVSAKVGSGGLITEFSVNTVYPYLSGVSLVVIYSNPLEPEVTIYLLDGGLRSASQQEQDIFYPVPIDPTLPGFNATLSLGISFSAQTPEIVPPGSHTCGDAVPPQSVYVDVNGVRLTSCAGGTDDGSGPSTSTEVLITVGGVGDLTDNPADPNQTPGDGAPVRVLDDELYDITTSAARDVDKLSLRFFNPSGDDQLFLAIVEIRTEGPVAGTEGPFGSPNCSDTVDNDGDGSIDNLDSGCAPPPEHCVTKEKDKLDVQWSTTETKGKKKEHRFTLERMTSAFCTNNPFSFPRKPGKKGSNGFDTHDGSGTGKVNGTTNATILWELLDGGEPSGRDFARMASLTAVGNQLVIVEAPMKAGHPGAFQQVTRLGATQRKM